MTRPTIRTYLLIGFSTLATLPVLVLGMLLTQQLAEAQVQQAQHQLDNIAATLAEDIDQYIGIRAAELDGFARQLEAQPTLDPVTTERVILRRRVQSGHFAYLGVADRAGTVVASDPSTGTAPRPSLGVASMRHTGQQTLVWPDQDPVADGLALRMLGPIWNTNGTVKGFVDAVLQPRDIAALSHNVTRKLPDVSALVLDADGRVLGSGQVPAGEVQHLDGIDLYAPAAEPGGRLGPDGSGDLTRAAVVPVASHGVQWTVVVTVPEATVQSRVLSVQHQTILLGLAALVMALVLAAVFAHGLSAPVRQLAAYATLIGSGQPVLTSPDLAPWHPRELNVLEREVVRMWRKLRVRQEDLEHQVAERTAELAASESYFRALIENSSDLILVLDQNARITYASPSHGPLLGRDAADLLGQYAFGYVHPDDAPTLERRFEKNRLTGMTGEPNEVRFRHADGSWRWLEAVASLAPASVGFGVVVNSRDITERKTSEAALEHLALHDPLTQLPNRTLLQDRLRQALNQSARTQQPMALLMLDLNRFKDINDSLGHQVGDRVLGAIADRLSDIMRASDSVARLGGDEFAVVLPGTDTPGALAVATAIARSLEQPIDVDGRSLLVGTSIGIALAPEHGLDAAELLRRADVAMYIAKRDNAETLVYSEEHDKESVERLLLASDLRQAIAEQALELHYQLKADLPSRSAIGVEALVRWRHAERGFIPPDLFVPIAEQTGLIQPLTRWVLETGLAQLHCWLDAGLDLNMAINVSVRNLNEQDLPELIADLLRTHDVPADRLRIEVTESSLMTDTGRAVSILSRLRDMGVGVAIDDFGTGYSSLAYLKRLPVDELKIDRSFVRELAQNHDDTAIVRTTIELGHELGLTVVAEGIEDEATWERLAALGCDLGQGYFFARPEPADRITQRLVTHGSSPVARAA